MVAILDDSRELRYGSRALQRYLQKGMWDVQGWLHPNSADIIASMSAVQVELGLTGSVGEIGVHHGKLFVLLMLASTCREPLFAIDVFEQQDKNVDRSGNGDRAIFEQNVVRFGGCVTDVEILQSSSLELTPETLAQRISPIRLCSMDGGHTAQCASHDFALLSSRLIPGGIIIVDDFFNQSWPGVMSGLIDTLRDPLAPLVPFLVTINKVLFADRASATAYRSRLRHVCASYFDKTDMLLGHEVDIYGINGKPVRPPFGERVRRTYQMWR